VSPFEKSAPPRRLASASFGEAAVDLVESFDRACKLAGLTHEAVASMMGAKKEALYQMLRQQRPLSLVRLLKLRDDADGRKFLRAYWPLIGEAMGLPEFADGLKVADALQQFIANLQVRMVKCELVSREVQDEKRSA
jgi:hypothetical protein